VGPDDSSALLSQLCHKQERSVTLTAHGNNVIIRLVADSAVTAKGFSAYVTQLGGGCGGLISGKQYSPLTLHSVFYQIFPSFSAPTGFIYSPNYHSNYDHDNDWMVRIHLANSQYTSS